MGYRLPKNVFPFRVSSLTMRTLLCVCQPPHRKLNIKGNCVDLQKTVLLGGGGGLSLIEVINDEYYPMRGRVMRAGHDFAFRLATPPGRGENTLTVSNLFNRINNVADKVRCST